MAGTSEPVKAALTSGHSKLARDDAEPDAVAMCRFVPMRLRGFIHVLEDAGIVPKLLSVEHAGVIFSHSATVASVSAPLSQEQVAVNAGLSN
ncbi:hypothetical protein KIPB_016586, partial [Kipferlia bialata]|eukprot:g16586.t1